MKLPVTGGAGFIGSTFIHRQLSVDDDDIIVVDMLTDAGDPANLAGPASGCDAIVNFAAESHVDRSIRQPTASLDSGVMGMYSLLEAARAEEERRGGEPIRLLQVSTDEVDGLVRANIGDGRQRRDWLFAADQADGIAYRRQYGWRLEQSVEA